MKVGRFPLAIIALVVICVAVVVIASAWKGDQPIVAPDVVTQVADGPNVDELRRTQPSLSESLGVDESDMVEVGGVKRPKRDVAFGEAKAEPVVSEKSPFPNAGRAPGIPRDANPEVAGLFAELSQEEVNPAAASALFAPEPFDRKEYEADREAWLTKIRPGRVYQPAQPGPDVVPIKSRTGAFQQVVQGEKVMLEVQAEPGAPVTFYTPQVGEFSNRLTTQSIEAAADGIARATYTATAGTLGIVDVLAASPVHSGQLRFKVRVSLPQ